MDGVVDEFERVWAELDPSGPPALRWIADPGPGRVTLLLGAFDPPTLAHLALVTAAGRPSGFCITTVLLGRPDDALLRPPQRLRLLAGLATEHRLGLAVANRGTYLEVARAGDRPVVFLVGSDKLRQLRDPRFYPDGRAGVRATSAEVAFRVVSRDGGEGERLLDDPRIGSISASLVRQRVREGRPVDGLVPRSVALALEGYTRSIE